MGVVQFALQLNETEAKRPPLRHAPQQLLNCARLGAASGLVSGSCLHDWCDQSRPHESQLSPPAATHTLSVGNVHAGTRMYGACLYDWDGASCFLLTQRRMHGHVSMYGSSNGTPPYAHPASNNRRATSTALVSISTPYPAPPEIPSHSVSSSRSASARHFSRSLPAFVAAQPRGLGGASKWLALCPTNPRRAGAPAMSAGAGPRAEGDITGTILRLDTELSGAWSEEGTAGVGQRSRDWFKAQEHERLRKVQVRGRVE